MKSSSSSLFPVETQKFLQLQSQPQKFAHVAEIFKNIKEIVNNLIEKPKSHHAQALMKKGFVYFIELKEVNRQLHTEIESEKEKHTHYKEKLNALNLRLQNLQYEKNHFIREIEICRNYKPKNVVEDLISEEEFLKTAPKEFLPQNLNDEHEVMLKLLNFELEQRKRLVAQLKELTARKKSLEELNATRSKFLRELQGRLKSINVASMPVQEYLKLNITSLMKQAEVARLLPSPLYILFTKIFAYKEAFNEDFDVKVEGSVDEAKQEAIRKLSEKDSEESNKLKQKPNYVTLSPEELYKSHPLYVVLIFFRRLPQGTTQQFGVVRFEYLIHLNVVTVNSYMPNNAQDKDVLVNLYPNDTGDESPNFANYVIFDNKKFVFDVTKKGRPFRWAQSLAGLTFLRPPPTQYSQEQTEVQTRAQQEATTSRSTDVQTEDRNEIGEGDYRIHEIMRRLKQRFLTRLALAQQLDQLC
jgi:THO complex subunit 5